MAPTEAILGQRLQRRRCAGKGSPDMDDAKIDRTTMAKLAKALEFICGPQHACVVALMRRTELPSQRRSNCARIVQNRIV